MSDSELKFFLYAFCQDFVNARIAATEEAIRAARDASENDTKSSAGDKYETTREMMQQEISRNGQQLAEAGKMRHALQLINPEKGSDTIGAGSIAETSEGNFYLAVSAGRVVFIGKNYQAISPASPIGQKLSGRKAGESVLFNGRIYRIDRVF